MASGSMQGIKTGHLTLDHLKSKINKHYGSLWKNLRVFELLNGKHTFIDIIETSRLTEIANKEKDYKEEAARMFLEAFLDSTNENKADVLISALREPGHELALSILTDDDFDASALEQEQEYFDRKRCMLLEQVDCDEVLVAKCVEQDLLTDPEKEEILAMKDNKGSSRGMRTLIDAVRKAKDGGNIFLKVLWDMDYIELVRELNESFYLANNGPVASRTRSKTKSTPALPSVNVQDQQLAVRENPQTPQIHSGMVNVNLQLNLGSFNRVENADGRSELMSPQIGLPVCLPLAGMVNNASGVGSNLPGESPVVNSFERGVNSSVRKEDDPPEGRRTDSSTGCGAQSSRDALGATPRRCRNCQKTFISDDKLKAHQEKCGPSNAAQILEEALRSVSISGGKGAGQLVRQGSSSRDNQASSSRESQDSTSGRRQASASGSSQASSSRENQVSSSRENQASSSRENQVNTSGSRLASTSGSRQTNLPRTNQASASGSSQASASGSSQASMSGGSQASASGNSQASASGQAPAVRRCGKCGKTFRSDRYETHVTQCRGAQ
ncbi:uncharacterized protein LOC131931310 [Physella acuta]|uniref:uncharacterized protein LOC131931310 n=1 Tax=Physella acuta TaxID=109671 RepID=UPI0027DB9DC1|nr:uncharacterized protein LOC131931310 [Physella acuta]